MLSAPHEDMTDLLNLEKKKLQQNRSHTNTNPDMDTTDNWLEKVQSCIHLHRDQYILLELRICLDMK